MNMYTVVETPTFLKTAEKIWTEQDRVEFVNWIASHPLAGDVILNLVVSEKFAGAVKVVGQEVGFA